MPTLTPQQRAFVRRRTRRADPDPSEGSGELNVVPFLDIVVNLILFLLVTTTTVLAISQVEAQLPGYDAPCRGGQCPEDSLELSVHLTSGGIVVAGSGGQVAEGCRETAAGGGTTLPSTATGYDFSALRSCAARIKDAHPAEDEVIVGADPTVPYEDVVGAMDALRNDGSRPLFPEVMLSAGVR